MFSSISNVFKQLIEGTSYHQQGANPNLAMASLLCEVADADHQSSSIESHTKSALLTRLLGVSSEESQTLINEAEEKVKKSASLYDFTSQLRELSQEARFELIKAMWEVANADGNIDPLEEAVIRKVAELLYVDHSEFIRAKLSVIDK
ncbi:TerB family tellurite resistance protein [Vibrio sp. S4M6]|uniref:tellurite resistance TerB family protein n=1 Tax=Vibrio sinus TaxID=2946865 RepID=UPI002029FD36|nr:TerB family tellurite resistance protein [Vibrio sinus]MCL9781210.1 TerB family tellurite resistance protein [Vibrio sinus]